MLCGIAEESLDSRQRTGTTSLWRYNSNCQEHTIQHSRSTLHLSVQAAPVMISSTQQQQQAPPPQQPPAQPKGPPKRECKQIRIRDPNQGGRDITEEIMPGGRSTTTPTSPQLRIRDPNQGGRDITEEIMLGGRSTTSSTPSQFRIRDPNQVGRDITEEIMPGGRSTITTTSPQPPGPSHTQQGQRKEPREIISSMSLSDNMQLSNAEKAWRPMAKMPTRSHSAEDDEDYNPEQIKNQELFDHLDSILEKLTPQKFQKLMKQVIDLRIDTEEKLTGAVDLIFEKVISEPDDCLIYANMCHCLVGLKVPTSDKPEVSLNFRKLLLNRSKKEFEKDLDEIFEKKQKEIEATNDGEERERLRVELQESRDQAHRRSLGNIKLTGELFKLRILKGAVMHDCIVKLLKKHDEESLECLCMLLSTIGKDLDFEKDKPRMDQYFNQMGKIIRERKTSSRIRLLLQDVLDLRKSNWVPHRGDQDPEGGGQTSQPKHEGWNTEPISKNRPIDTTHLNKTTKFRIRDPNQGGRDITEEIMSGGRSTITPTPPRPPGSGRFLHCQRKQPRKIYSSSDDLQLHKAEEPWKPKKRMSTQSRGTERPEDDSLEQDKTQELFYRLRSILEKLTPQRFCKLMKQVTYLTIDTEERLKGAIDLIYEKAISEPDSSVVYANMCRCLMGLKVPASDKPGVFLNFRKLLLNRCQKEFEEDLDEIFEKKQQEIEAAKEGEERERLRVELQESRDQARRRSLGNIKFIGEVFKLKMLTEAIMHDCIVKLLKKYNEESLECLCLLLSTIGKDLDFEKAKPRMDQYFNNIDKIIKERKTSSRISLLLQDIFDLRKNNWVPHKGHQGPKIVDQILKGAESQAAVKEEVNKFVTEQKVEFTTGEEMESKEVDKKKVLTGEELSKQLDRLIQDKANNQRIRDWAEANLDEQQTASNQFVRALMTSVCQSAIICDNPYRMDARQISQRASLLQRYLSDEQKELQALYALQALMVHMEQPANLLRIFFDVLYDEDVIKEEAFYKWETSKDPAEQTGKGVALKSVTAFFTWLREAEEESDEE